MLREKQQEQGRGVKHKILNFNTIFKYRLVILINQCFHLVRDIGQCCTVSPDLDPPDSLSPPGPGLDCHKVSAWSQFLHHSSGNTQTSQSRNPRNHELDLRGQGCEIKRSKIVSYICSCYRSCIRKVSPGNWLE